MGSTRILTVAAAMLAVAAVAGCASDRPVAGRATAGGSGADVAAVAPVAATSLVATEVAALGAVLTDERGMTLYRFDEDTARPPSATCDGACAVAWPPLLSTGADVRLDGVDPALVGTVTRRDGGTQVTVNGWPLYRFGGDAEPGEANGHGVRGTWFAASPVGGKAGRPAPGGTSPGGTSPSGTAPAATLAVMRVGDLGEIVTDERGMTLYRFDRDSAQPSRSVCDDECAAAWPPVLTGSPDVQVTGIDPALVGTVVRSDGRTQVTIAGQPVYRFAKDAVPCDTNGHGIGGVWFAVTPQGQRA